MYRFQMNPICLRSVPSFSSQDDDGESRRATRNFRGQGSRRQKGHNKKFCVKGISLRLCSLDLETEEIFEAFS